MTIKEKFGCRVKELRQSQHLSQEKFALQIGMDRTYLASIERGRRNISLENISKIAAGFGISLEELFHGIVEEEHTEWLRKSCENEPTGKQSAAQKH